jgi:hypothetical protein
MDLSMLDSEAFARVIASGQQQQHHNLTHPTIVDEEMDDDESLRVAKVDDTTYRPSGVGLALQGLDPVFAVRLDCLPVLDVYVCFQLL